jgi:CubicO group peptidase (beta-lactamase class C family)
MDRARQLFLRQHAQGAFPGGQLVVRRGGEVVLELAVGLARGFRRDEQQPEAPVTPATRFSVFSASKPVVALAIAMLEERGAVDVEAPVAKYWPGFAAHGKAELTVLDVLTHRAGVFTPELVMSPHLWGNEQRVREAVIAATPRWPRGTLAYQPYEYGWILAEVVRAATSRRFEDFIRDEIAGPAGIPGLRFGAAPDELGTMARTYWVGTKPVYVAGNELSQTFEHANNLPEALTAIVPGAGLVCSAGDLAVFYEVLVRGGVCRSGQRLVSEALLRRYTTAGPLAFDRSNRLPLRVGRGFLQGTRTPSIYGWWGTQRVYGHAGAFCTLAYADPDRDLAVAIVTNGNRGPWDALFRFAPLGSALRAS